MKYKVTNEDWDCDMMLAGELKHYTIFESDNLEDCKNYTKENNIPESRIVKSSGRIAIGDWYGACDNDCGWEFD